MPLGLRLLRDGPVADAHHLLLLSAKTLRTTDIVRSREAAVQASLAAWSAGDREGYLAALAALHPPDGSPPTDLPDGSPPAHPTDRTPPAHPPDGSPLARASDGSPRARDPLPADVEAPVDAFWRAYSDGMRSVLQGDFEHAASLLRPVLNVLSAQHQPLGCCPRARSR
ncbi:hypothetical protein [Streptomyces sp. CdTB01]|uniref:hypothetical protein n=1 Tax=Streptomyces sp. CdTB01 TaxID=1725411 RepID=UPI00073A7611|nr:hypothetical protein [Streptomyces sp. CdTB01]ALV38067.1 hypothetical protein AS200_43050 [Streptomyces sp. CdTB01]